MPAEDASLCAVREAIFHVDVRDQHHSHWVLSSHGSIDIPIAGHVEDPLGLRLVAPTDDFDMRRLVPLLVGSELCFGVSCPTFRFDAQAVVAIARQPFDDSTVPPLHG